MRLALILSVIVIWTVWTYLSLKKGEIQEIPTGVVAMAIGLFACKVGQSAFEKAVSTTETSSLITPEGASTSLTKTSDSAPVVVEDAPVRKRGKAKG